MTPAPSAPTSSVTTASASAGQATDGHAADAHDSTRFSQRTDLGELLRAFRQLQLQHGRVINHESTRLGMGATDIRALFFVNEAGDLGTSPKYVADFLELSTGATTSLVDRLVDAGALLRLPHPSDRRSVVLRLTDEGHAIVGRVAAVYRRALGGVIPESESHELAATFRAMAAALAAGSPCAG